MESLAKSYKIRWSDEAAQDHESIFLYITNVLKEPEIAMNIAALIFDKISNLPKFPLKHPIVASIFFKYSDVRRMPIQDYNVYYRVDETDKIIEISRILHSRCNLNKK